MSIASKNKFFRTTDSSKAQRLYERYINQAIRIRGIDVYYIARTYQNFDKLYETDDQSLYQNAWLLAVYIKNVLGFTGDREFLSKFAGLEIRDQIIVTIPRYGFEQVIASDSAFPSIPNTMPGLANRPREGDLLWLPMNQKCFQIKYVNLTDMFFPFGKSFTWECTCELFEYSNEIFNTGISEIDRIQKQADFNILDFLLTDINGTPLLTVPNGDYWTVDRYNLSRIDPIADNDNINVEANNYIEANNSNIDPFVDFQNKGSNF